MADTVTVRAIKDTDKEYGVHLTCTSDGTGESAVAKVDKSALAAAVGGAEAASLELTRVRWAIGGFTSVVILWDHNTDDRALTLPTGSGAEDFEAEGVLRDYLLAPGLTDPRSTGGSGDILLTSNGAINGAAYDITLWFRKAVA